MSNPRKLIHSTSTTGYDIFSLTVPSSIGRQIPDGTKFRCRLTDEGILFVPHTEEESPPKWVKDRIDEAGGVPVQLDDGDGDQQ